MTGYTVHTGASKKFVAGWDNIFGGEDKKQSTAGKKKKKSAAKASGKKAKSKSGQKK